MAEGNGHYDKFAVDLKALADRQEMLVTRAIEDLKDVMHTGHNSIAEEIRKIREVGALPIPLVEKLIDHQNASSNRSSDRTFKIAMMFLVVFLGLKAFFPQVLGG